MTWKGYAARIDYDDEDGIFTGRIAGIRDGVGFHADTLEGLHEAFREAVADYLDTCAKLGRDPQKDAVPWSSVAGADRRRDARRGPA